MTPRVMKVYAGLFLKFNCGCMECNQCGATIRSISPELTGRKELGLTTSTLQNSRQKLQGPVHMMPKNQSWLRDVDYIQKSCGMLVM